MSTLLMIRLLNLWYFDGDGRGYIVFLAAGALVDYILKLPEKKVLKYFHHKYNIENRLVLVFIVSTSRSGNRIRTLERLVK